jgi:hypothetical protein
MPDLFDDDLPGSGGEAGLRLTGVRRCLEMSKGLADSGRPRHPSSANQAFRLKRAIQALPSPPTCGPSARVRR